MHSSLQRGGADNITVSEKKNNVLKLIICYRSVDQECEEDIESLYSLIIILPQSNWIDIFG